MLDIVPHSQSRIRAIAAGYPELIAVLAAAIVGLTVQRPLAWLAGHQGINVLLAILVFATAITIDPAALRRLLGAWRSLVIALIVGITVLPVLSWAVSRIVAAGSLRDGVLVVGLAPCEIASVATTAMAGGEAAVSAGVLIGSTVAAVALAGPILTLEAGHAGVSPGGIIANLALVVALPLAVGLAARACAEAPPRDDSSGAARLLAATRVLSTARAERVASQTALAAVAALVALIAAEIRLSSAYLAVAGALLLFLLGSALVGRALGVRAARPTATALLLTTSMRDFAIAAGLAAAAFGPAAAAPLGLYGVAVLVWGTAVAGVLRQRAARTPAGTRNSTPMLWSRPAIDWQHSKDSEIAMGGVTYDTGALLAAERNSRKMWELQAGLIAEEVVPVVPAPVLAQAWRGGAQQHSPLGPSLP